MQLDRTGFFKRLEVDSIYDIVNVNVDLSKDSIALSRRHRFILPIHRIDVAHSLVNTESKNLYPFSFISSNPRC
jgi:hypothetical protein